MLERFPSIGAMSAPKIRAPRSKGGVMVRNPRVVERLHRRLEADALLSAEQRGSGHAAVLEDHVCSVRAAKPHLLVVRRDRDARRSALDEKRRDAARAGLLWRRARKNVKIPACGELVVNRFVPLIT